MRRVPPLPRGAPLPLLPLFLLSQCASSAPLQRRRTHPSSRAAHVALERVTPRAERCLRAGDRVTVEGFFDGPSGRYRVERVGASEVTTPEAVRQCVALQLEGARVSPFAAPRHDARWTVADTISPTVRAMLAADASAPVATSGGEIDLPAVVRVVRGQVGQFRRCYEDALRGDPSLRGRITVRFTVSVDGRVTEATAAADPAGLAPVGHCILGHLRTEAFPRPHEAAADFSFPFSFAPEDRLPRGSTASP